MLVGGSDPFSKIAFTGFSRVGAVAPERCQPFDKNRKGMLVGEGAGVLVLETLDAATARGAEPYAEILAYGLSCDAHHMTAPHPEGEGIMAAMQRALAAAGIGPEDVDYLSAHGTGTPANDKAESVAIRRVFGDATGDLAVSSIKSMLGHTMGAASALEAIACALAIRHGRIPPTINHETPDPDIGLDVVPNESRVQDVTIALNNGFAFGGNNSSLVLRKLA